MYKWYLINSKGDDYGSCRRDLLKCKKKDLEYVYNYEEVPVEDVVVLTKYFEVVNEVDYEDFGYKTLAEYLEEYY